MTDITGGPTSAANFLLRSGAASLACLGLVRLDWIEHYLALPLTRAQGNLAVGLFGMPAAPVAVTLACSGADASALCVGAILVYPAALRTRLAGIAGGVALVLGLNTLRIGTLGQAVGSEPWFSALHLYVWPAVLTLAVVAYVFTWMRFADREPGPPTSPWRPQPSRRFVVLTVGFVLLFSVASPILLASPAVLALAGLMARAAAAMIGLAGITAYAADNVLWTAHGGFLVTQECIATPLIPVYLAAIAAYATTWRQRISGLLATLPLFAALGIARLLIVAVPDTLASPTFFVHAFNQLLLGAVVICVAALWRHGRRRALRYAVSALIVGAMSVYLIGPFSTRLVAYSAGAPLDDPQGAIAFLPAFQLGLYFALCIAAFVTGGWRRFAAGLTLLALVQAACLLALSPLLSHAGLAMHVANIRALAVAAPVLIFAAAVTVGRPHR